MNKNYDVIAIDLERFPKVGDWGELMGSFMGIEFLVLPDEYWDYIPQEVTHIRYSFKTADLGYRYWGEYRAVRSEYGEDEENGTTQKDKVEVPTDIFSNHVLPFMKGVIRLKVQEIFEKRHNTLRTKYSHLEEATWQDQLAESKAYLDDNTFEPQLINRLAEVRGLTTEQFATKVVTKQQEWKKGLYDLAVQEQQVLSKLKLCKNTRDANVFIEDYFGIPMPPQLCVEKNRCIKHDDGRIERKEPFVRGLKF